MLERMREGSQGIVAKSILVVIILSFALAGVSSYLGTTSETSVVTVNGEGISPQSVEQAYQNERARLQQEYGERFDLIAATPNFAQQVRSQVTQTLVTERLIAQAVEEMGLRVSDDEVKETIRNISDFQVDGKFNNNLYLSLLRNNNLSPSQYSSNLKENLVRMQLLETLGRSEFVLPSEIEQVSELQGQQRVARLLNIRSADFSDQVITEDEIQAFYDQNQASFQDLEQVNIEYVLLDAAKLDTDTALSEQDIQTYYEQHQDEYQRTERRKVAHIFIEGDSTESKQKAEAILAEIKAGADFSELAKSKSEDVYSASNDGELDWFERGVMDPAFDKSSFALTADAPMSDIVKSEFGFHIIKLIEAQDSETIPLAEVKDKIQAALVIEKKKDAYNTLYQTLSEVAFESPDSLIDTADEVNGEIQTTGLFSSNDIPELLNKGAVRALLFDQDFREEGLNSEVFELNNTQAIVIRVKDHKAAATKPLTEVKEQIKTQLTDQKSVTAAKQFVEALMVKLDAGESIESELKENNLSFTTPATLARYSRDYDTKVIQRLFQLAKPQADKVTRDYVVTAQGDFAVIELSEVIEQDENAISPETTTQLTTMLQRSTSDATYQALVSYLLENAEVLYPTN